MRVSLGVHLRYESLFFLSSHSFLRILWVGFYSVSASQHSTVWVLVILSSHSSYSILRVRFYGVSAQQHLTVSKTWEKIKLLKYQFELRGPFKGCEDVLQENIVHQFKIVIVMVMFSITMHRYYNQSRACPSYKFKKNNFATH